MLFDHPFARLSRFTLLSGIGWTIDVGLTLGLVTIGLPVAIANAVGAATAVSFVYATALRHVFQSRPSRFPGFGRFARYLVYQVFAIAAASALIGALAEGLSLVFVAATATQSAAAAKVVVTPLTLYSNYVFMSWLVEGRAIWR